MKCMQIFCNTFILCFLCAVSSGLTEGDPCTFEKNASKGVCKYLGECESALKKLYGDKQEFPQVCYLRGTMAIICCEIKNTTYDEVSNRHFNGKKPPPFVPVSVLEEVNDDGIRTASREPGVVSRQKCDEYAKYVYEEKFPETLSVNPKPIKVYECLFDKIPLIIGGTNATPHEFPHMALLGYQLHKNVEITWNCGGSLISERFILTAAHCLLRNREIGSVKVVRLGINHINDQTNAKDFEVAEIIKHPLYKTSNYFDIGLLKLAKDVEMSPRLRPACLYTETDIPYENGIASGWGAIKRQGDFNKNLLKVVLEYFPVNECNDSYAAAIKNPQSTLRNGVIDATMICAGTKNDFNDTCQGDSGGPLQVYHEDTETNKCMYDILGITSFGHECGLLKGQPGVYTRVSHYIQWIEDIVWPLV